MEFLNKTDAKNTAELLNATPMGEGLTRALRLTLAYSFLWRLLSPLTSTVYSSCLPRMDTCGRAGSNKRGFYNSDLWNIKYLKHFKWHHLTEKIGGFLALFVVWGGWTGAPTGCLASLYRGA